MKAKILYCNFVLLLLAVLGLTACGGSSESSNFAAATTAYDMEVSQETIDNKSYSEDLATENSGVTDITSTPQVLPSNRKLIRNVEMTAETDTFDELLKTLTAQVGEFDGYMEQSDISGNSLNHQNQPIPRSAFLTIRIPLNKVDSFITMVQNNGNVIHKSETTQDVTLQYSDLESRKKSLTVEQERIWALLEKADTLEAVIILEEHLSEIRYQLESMESQLRLYDNQVNYSTIYLSINEIIGTTTFTAVEPQGVIQRIQNGFSKNLKSIYQGFTNFFVWLISSSPFWFPFILIVIVLLLIIHRHNRKLHRPSEKQSVSDSNELK